MATVIISTGLSTTKKSAQSKKCRLLAKVADHSLNYKVAIAIRLADPLLAEVMTEAEILDCWSTKTRLGKGSKTGSTRIKIEVDLDEVLEELINNSPSLDGILSETELDKLQGLLEA